MLSTTGTNNYDQILQFRKECHAAVRMLIETERLKQFRVASMYDRERPVLVKIPYLD